MKKSELVKIIKEEIKKLNEYFVSEGDSLDAALVLNIFTDFDKHEGVTSQFGKEAKDNKQWMKIDSKYSKKSKKLEQLILKNKNKELNDIDAKSIEDVMYDGSDAYDSIDDAIEYLPKIYDNQIKAIIKVLKNY